MGDAPQIGKVFYKSRTTGIEYMVTPMTIMAQRIIEQKARSIHPDIDPKPYEVKMENSLVPGDVHPGESNPKYIEEMEKVENRRVVYTVNATLTMCVTPANMSVEDLLKQYKTEIDFLQQDMMEGFDSTKDEFKTPWVLFLYSFGLSEMEMKQVMGIIHHRLPLVEAEVRGAYAFFRWVGIQGQKLPVRDRQQKSRDSKEADKSESSADNGGNGSST